MVSILRSETVHAREGNGAPMRPWARTGSIDVEELARWAYAVQMVERFERAGLHAIEAEVAGFEPNGYSACGVGQLMQIDHLGCRVDRSSGIVRDVCHPAAYALAAALTRVEHADRVRFHAKAGTRPVAWVEPAAKARASIWIKPGETAMVEYQGPGRKGAYCPVILLWDQQRERWGRADYASWWAGLTDLAWQLSMMSLGFLVTGPAAPSEPWLPGPEAGRGAPPDGSSPRSRP